MIPDLAQRLDEMNLVERTGYELVRSQLGDKFVDDMFVSPDGRVMYVSRANLSDVVAIDLLTHEQLWRFETAGIHADHMALSPDSSQIVPYWAQTSTDGEHCFISNSASDTVSVISYATAQEVARVPVGDFPQRERNARVAEAVLDTLAPAAG